METNGIGWFADDLKLKDGDKFTKQPVWIGKHLFMLGRDHIHSLNLESGFVNSWTYLGENAAERAGLEARQEKAKQELSNLS